MARVNVYVDGLNLYNGALRDTPYRWLDLRKLGQALLKPDDVVQRIRYFTTRLDASDDPTVSRRQQTYIRALRTIPGLTIHYSTFVTQSRANGRGTPPRSDVTLFTAAHAPGALRQSARGRTNEPFPAPFRDRPASHFSLALNAASFKSLTSNRRRLLPPRH